MGDMVIGGNPCEECKFNKESCRKYKPQCLFRDDKKQQIVMNKDKEIIEIPFGAFDSELGVWEYTIPEGCEVVVENGKVIVRKSESEDEKIRKTIINLVDTEFGDRFPFDGFTREQMLAWLEKQGEQKPTETTDFRTWKYIVDAVLTEKEGIGQYIDNPWTTEVAKKLQKRFGSIEQKPAWSEEDETGLTNTIIMLKEGASLHFNKNDITKAVDWLKSLRPQNTWKPSDEQMKLLREVQQALLGKDCHNRFVNFMYELKRLREE